MSVRAGFGRTPLWARLVAGTLLLVTLALAVTGLVGTRLLDGYLLERTDDQLAQGSRALVRASSVDPGRLPSRPGQQFFGQYFAVLLDDKGQPTEDLLRPFGDKRTPELPTLDRAEVEDRAREPFTVDSAAGADGRWRAIALPVPSGEGSLVVAISLDDVDGTVRRLRGINLVVGAAVLAALGVAGYGLVRVSLRPLAEIESTAGAIAGGDLSHRVPERDPGTELGRLGYSLNAMLTQIESAFRDRAESESAARYSEERMRRFVADASHELRTPLTSIRGFAELYRQEGADDPAHLMRRIEEAGARMGVLVDDLLLLARLDQHRPLEREPVDLLDVAAEAVLDARTLAPDREIELVREDGAGDNAEPLIVQGDADRIRQILGNLMSNALAHTPDGTPVRVGLGRRDQVAILEVADEGPGMSEEDAARVFERFFRVDPARSRTGPAGAGLGLSIVAALTEAHGGTVELDTAPGEGATFRVLLPSSRRRSRPDAGP